MIGRADIEGSKSNVAMNAWLPQASYPCGNFSDTSKHHLLHQRIDRACFRSRCSNWKQAWGKALTIWSTQGFCPSWPYSSNTRVILLQMCRPSRTPTQHSFSNCTVSSCELDKIWVRQTDSEEEVFHSCRSSLLFYTFQTIHPSRVESSSTGSSFPAISSTPVPMTVGSPAWTSGQRKSR